MHSSTEARAKIPFMVTNNSREMIKAGWSLAGTTTNYSALFEIRRDYMAKPEIRDCMFTRDDNFNFFYWVKFQEAKPKIPAHKAATLGYENLSSQTNEQKKAHIRTLAQIRKLYRMLCTQPDRGAGFRAGAILAIQAIEAATHEDELWTYLPDEKDLTDHDRIGEHIAVTRMLMGFCA